MRKVVRLTESDLVRLVKRVIKEQTANVYDKNYYKNKKNGTVKIDRAQIVSVDGNPFDYTKMMQVVDDYNFGGRGTPQTGELYWVYKEDATTGVMGPGETKSGVEIYTQPQEKGQFIGSITFK